MFVEINSVTNNVIVSIKHDNGNIHTIIYGDYIVEYADHYEIIQDDKMVCLLGKGKIIDKVSG